MTQINRRRFCSLSTGAVISAASAPLLARAKQPAVVATTSSVKVSTAHYGWEYSLSDDTFILKDSGGRIIVSGKLEPTVIVAPKGNPLLRKSSPGTANAPRVDSGRIQIDYEKVNGDSRLSVVWRFDESGIWMDPIQYESSVEEDVVSLHYFTSVADGVKRPNLNASCFVVPGIVGSAAISPILPHDIHLNETVWLGRGSSLPGLNQQWGLPVHYFSGFSTGRSTSLRYSRTRGHSDAFVCGLADLPNGDLFLGLYEGNVGIQVDYRSDLWGHVCGPGKIPLGATFYWSLGSDYYEAIASYYDGLVRAGVIHRKESSETKMAVALTPQFCTWGSEIDREKANFRLDQGYLDKIYSELKASGMKAGMFSIDDKWEGSYGTLEHDKGRLPDFEKFLDRVRIEGHRIGIWAALMRCQTPSLLGLTEDHMMKMPDGRPFKIQNEYNPEGYYIIDFTQPLAAEALARVSRQFIRRYKPDLFKFDFGYELPAMSIATAKDKSWSGERLMRRGLDIVIPAMREVNPDLVVMYYQLSPLFLDYFDLHSIDDLFMSAGEYEVDANRRIFFSSLLGPLGIPTYGSSGYDWKSTPEIWFDSAVVGTLGSQNDFESDEQGEKGGPAYASKYNGLCQVIRPSSTFKVIPLDTNFDGPALGAHARSWARIEKNQLVLLAYRPPQAGLPTCLNADAIDARVKDAIRTRVPVVVASRGDQSIAEAKTLALVPYASGEIMIRRQQGSRAEVQSHYFGNTSRRSEAAIVDGFLKLTVDVQPSGAAPLEWIELRIS